MMIMTDQQSASASDKSMSVSPQPPSLPAAANVSNSPAGVSSQQQQNNPITRKLNKILENRIENDKVKEPNVFIK